MNLYEWVFLLCCISTFTYVKDLNAFYPPVRYIRCFLCSGSCWRHVISLQQVCDSEWHHLSLSVQFPSVTLYVDGVTFDPALIHDNGAIPNPAPRQRMFIGACWGKTLKFMRSEFQISGGFWQKCMQAESKESSCFIFLQKCYEQQLCSLHSPIAEMSFK